jgi:hypothetical protein
MIVLDLSILNQKGTPMFNSDLTANRPAAGIVGRIFIAIDAPYGIFRDTGTAWDQISSAGGADTNIYNTDGTLTGTRTVSSGGFQLVFNPQTTFFSSLIPSTSASSFAVLGSNALTFAANFSSSNIGNVYSANGAINAQIFSGNATFAQANLASAMVNVNKIDFSSAGGDTITMTQSTAPGIRAMTGVQNQIQFTGSHNGTITHAAISQNLGFFRETGSTKILTITNAYSHLINPLDDYGAGFTFTNRWGIYQAGASDKNYFAANTLFGTTTDSGQRLQVNGDTFLKGSGATSATNALLVQNSSGTQLAQFRNDQYIQIGTTTSILQLGTFINFGNVGLYPINNGNYAIASNATELRFDTTFSGSTTGDFGFQFGTFSAHNTSNANPKSVTISASFFPTSGTQTFTNTYLNPTINQTGGANGITRGLYIQPTLTAAADWRAIEISAGVSVLAPSTTASATLRVPSGTAPTTPTNGDIWFDGTNLFMRIGGTTKTFTII